MNYTQGRSGCVHLGMKKIPLGFGFRRDCDEEPETPYRGMLYRRKLAVFSNLSLETEVNLSTESEILRMR